MSDQDLAPNGAPRAPAIVPGPVLTMDEIIERHEGEWILMRVTAHDEYHWPSAGRILIHAPHQQDIVRALQSGAVRPWDRRDGPPQPLYSFQAYPTIGPDADEETFLRALLSDEEDPWGPETKRTRRDRSE